MDDQRLRLSERLRCPRAYQRVFEQGEKLVGSLFILYVLPTSEPYSPLGMAGSQASGNTVVGNRIKRPARGRVPAHKVLLLFSYDLVWMARPEAGGAAYGHYTPQ